MKRAYYFWGIVSWAMVLLTIAGDMVAIVYLLKIVTERWGLVAIVVLAIGAMRDDGAFIEKLLDIGDRR
jgi:hypothetical protein